MKSSQNLKGFRQLSVDESVRICGGNPQPDLIYLPMGIGITYGDKIRPFLADLYMKYSLFLNF
jgi:hypothetical protein